MSKRTLFLFLVIFIFSLLSGCSVVSDLGVSKSNPKQISTYEDFISITNTEKYRYYILINDITMPEGEAIRYSLGFLNGSLDGNGYSLKNFRIIARDSIYDVTKDVLGIGIFSYVHDEGVVKNLKLDNFNLTVNEFNREIGVGSIAGILNKSASCINVSGDVKLTVSSRSEVMQIGGLFGVANGNISDIDLTVNIDSNNNTISGGLVGEGEVNLKDSRVRGFLSSNAVNVGGMIGHGKSASGSNLFTDIEINVYSSEAYSVGGIIGKYTNPGRSDKYFTDLMSVGPIIVYDAKTINAGGIVGNIGSNTYIRDVFSLSNIYHGNSYSLKTSNNYAYGAIAGKSSEDTQVRNGYYCTDLGVKRAIGNFVDDDLYHFGYGSRDYRTNNELINMTSDNWDYSDGAYPVLSKFNYEGNNKLKISINKVIDLDLMYKKPWGYYELNNDLDYTSLSLNTLFTSLKPFCGVFNGNKHNLSNISIIEEDEEISLFKYTSNADIKGLRIDDVYISLLDKLVLNDGYGFIAYRAVNTNISDIEATGNAFISTSYSKGNFGMLVGSFEGGGKLENILVDVTFAVLDFTTLEELDREFNVGAVVGRLTGEGQYINNVVTTSGVLASNNHNIITNTVAIVFGQISGVDIDITNVFFEPDEGGTLASFVIKHDVELDKFLEIIPLIGDNFSRIDTNFFIVSVENIRLK